MKLTNSKSNQTNSIFDSVHSQQISITHSYQTKNPQQQNVFSQPTYQAKNNARRILATQIKSTGNDPNANFKSLITIFLKMIFQKKKNKQLLNSLKSALSKKQLNLTIIKNKPQRNIDNLQMKKILNDYFEILSAKSWQHNQNQELEVQKVNQNITGLVVQTIQHHPIILQIMTLFFRTLLLTYNSVKNIDNFLLPASTQQAFYIICEIFDINCRIFGSFYQFMQDGLFICSHDNKEFIFGNFYSNQMQLRKAQPNLSQSTNLYLKQKAQRQLAKRSLPLEGSSQSYNSKSSDSAGGFGYTKNNTPFFQADSQTPCFGKKQQQSNFNFQRRRDNDGDSGQKIKKLTNHTNINNTRNSQLGVGGRIQKVFGIVSIIESQQQFSKSNAKQSEVINIQIQSPVDAFQTNPISPTTWSQFTNRLKQIKVRQQEQNIINNKKSSNKNSNLFQNLALGLPKSLNQINQRRKSPNQSIQKKVRDISASQSNKINYLFERTYTNPFSSSHLDNIQIKRIQTSEQKKKLDQLQALQYSKSQKSVNIYQSSKHLMVPCAHQTKSLSTSEKKQAKYFLKVNSPITRFPYLNQSKSQKKIKMLTCQCRTIKKQRIMLSSNIYSVQIVSQYHQLPLNNSNKYGYNQTYLTSSKPENNINNQNGYLISVSSTNYLKKKYEPEHSSSNCALNIPLQSSGTRQKNNYSILYQPALSNRKSQTITPNTPKDKDITQSQKQDIPSSFNIKNSEKNDTIKQPYNQFQKIFKKKKERVNELHLSSDFQQNNSSNKEELLHYLSKPNLSSQKKNNQLKQNKYFNRFQKNKNISMRQQSQSNFQKSTRNNKLKFKQTYEYNSLRFHSPPPKIKHFENKGMINEKSNENIKKFDPDFIRGRKFSYNISSPPKNTANQQFFNSQKVKNDLLMYHLSTIQQKQRKVQNFPAPKAFILNKKT